MLNHDCQQKFGKLQIVIDDEINRNKPAIAQKTMQIVSFTEKVIKVDKVVHQDAKISVKIYKWGN